MKDFLASTWESIKNFFISNTWKIAWFLVVFILGLALIKIILNISRRTLRKSKMEGIAQNFCLAFIKFFLYLIWILILLSIVGVNVTGIVTAFSAIILAIGMALESNIANLANGIIIVSTGMFKCGDFIEVSGVSGSITKINFLFTTIITTDNKRITLPNTSIVNSPVTNYGANKTRRVDFTFSVAYESDVELVKKIILDVINSNGCVRLDKAPFCRLKTLNASSLDFFANCWVDSGDYWDVYYYVIENVYNEFKRNNVSVPYNQLEVRSREDKVVMPVVGDKLPERVEKVRKEDTSVDLENDSFRDMLRKTREHNKEVREEKREKKAEKKHQKEEKKHAKETK